MSLRLRLTLVYSGMLSGFVVLLSILIYAFVSMLFVNFVDEALLKTSNQLISQIRADSIGNLEFSHDLLLPSENVLFQIWSKDHQLMDYSDSASQLTQALNPRMLSSEEAELIDVNINNVFYRTITVPLKVEGQHYGWLQVGLELTSIRYSLGLIKIAIVFSALFAIIVSAVLGWIVIGEALLPLAAMADIANRITATNDLSQRIPIRNETNDEINTLALNFNQTFVLLERLFNAKSAF